MPSDDDLLSSSRTFAGGRLSEVACVVSAFRPSLELLPNVASLLSQAGKVIVVDDGSGPGYDDTLDKVAMAGADVVRLSANSGIGAALNKGIERARQSGAIRYVVTVDQDSALPQSYVQSLLSAEAAARAQGITPGLIGPARIHGNPVMSAGTRNGIVLGKEPIQSGLMVTTDALDHLGKFREELFIDLVDTEFYLRALEAGWPTVLADAEFDHSLGTLVEARVFGRPVTLPGGPLKVRVAAGWRYYYIFRNRLLVSKQYARRHPLWAAAGYWADLRHLAMVTVFAPGRSTRLASVVAGLADGFRGRTGKKPGA
ncbi:glycosyltransferase [Pseudarthrobacter phenanthrenivorans]|uniref:glycosyltransferase n=1 Tax=Pseudarthrobacter phenanthrenivorans TaxID=361575 RepID=UPI00112BAF07|nr:glycosyltransferase [Pseudarthrobacter phenanthrenivorans]TPV52175.1 glycosyltransferase [Pseudarthrobacter phenanthrenivorans]